MVVGGYALAFHGAPRYTGDIDLYVRQSVDNARRIMAALDAFGFGGVGLSAADFQEPDQVVQLGVPPVRVDILTSIEGVEWEDADGRKQRGAYGGVPIHYIGRREYIANKRALGRKKDLADIEALGEEE